VGSGLEDIQIPDDGGRPNKRALVISAHPDDSEFGVGGTAALWSRNGWEFYHLICTDGAKGSEDPEMTPEKAALRIVQAERERLNATLSAMRGDEAELEAPGPMVAAGVEANDEAQEVQRILSVHRMLKGEAPTTA
jgi:LmbE family N-acetylglucosaminyl deacetylase